MLKVKNVSLFDDLLKNACHVLCTAFVLNPAGKSHICVLHEYAQHAMRIQPRYIFEELGVFSVIRNVLDKLVLKKLIKYILHMLL